MRKILLIILLAIGCEALAQNPEIKSDLPTIIPPSPTVAALMKFEEIPVSNYTGVPDINIPLFKSPTHSKDINLDISLKYHPANIAADERASDIGLGWSLFAGGTISRTVKGLPDEMFKNSTSDRRIGLYHTVASGNGQMFGYYDFNETISQGISNSNEQFLVDDFLWETNSKGKFDTEHDLWQFNFMGKTGRFYIKKNINTGQLEVMPLDDYRIKITNSYLLASNNSIPVYTPLSFTVYDEKGYIYLFNVVEETNTTVSIKENYQNFFEDYMIGQSQLRYPSAFHLAEIRDNNNKLILKFDYDNSQYRESYVDVSSVSNDFVVNIDQEILYTQPSAGCPYGGVNSLRQFRPNKSTISNTRITKVKKITQITVEGILKANFKYVKGRDDTNITLNDSTVVLKEVEIKSLNDSIFKVIKLKHNYSHVIDDRLVLSEIEEFNSSVNEKKTYEFSYEENDTLNYFIGKDYWGYFNRRLKCQTYNNDIRKVDPVFCSTDVLQKIKYPTGGCTIFDFESNTYSYIGDQLVDNFEENPINIQNTFNESFEFTYDHPNIIPGPQPLHYSSTKDQYVKFRPSITDIDEASNYKGFTLTKVKNGVTTYTTIKCPELNGGCCIDYVLEAGANYTISMFWTNTDFEGTETIDIEYSERIAEPKQYLFGGGNRIKRIGYFTEDVPKDYYKYTSSNPSIEPAKQKEFKYNFFGQNNTSSGSLVSQKPLYNYSVLEKVCFTCIQIIDQVAYDVTTSFNNLVSVKTSGGDVGYKNVSVFESGNGHIDLTYSSPINEPESNYNYFAPPFIPTENFDFKRGLLESQSIYDNNGRLLKSESFQYDKESESYIVKTGIKLIKNDLKYLNPSFPNYISYNDAIGYCAIYPEINCVFEENVQNNPNIPICPCLCFDGEVSGILSHGSIYQAYGWSKLLSKNTKNYFYDTNNTQKIVETNETYTYNPTNKQIAESTVTNSNQGEVLKTKYFYHTGNSSYSQNRIAEIEKIETYRGSELLSTSQINYANNWSGNASYLPQSIVTSKGNATLENRLIYELYDEYGNPLQLKQESGTFVTYIWGYNKTQPIAKIENATYAQVSSYVSNLQTLSNGTDEANLIIALNALRTALPNAMITTLTYIPLVGVHTITDPKGDIQTYEYDTFGRLKAVYDKDGYKLAENDYHYRTQN